MTFTFVEFDDVASIIVAITVVDDIHLLWLVVLRLVCTFAVASCSEVGDVHLL